MVICCFYSHFPIQHFICIRLLPCSWLTTFRQSYLWIRLGSSSKPVFSFHHIACNDIWIFITTILTHPQTPHLWWELPLGKFKRLDLYIRKYVSALVYTFSPCVFDTRHIGSTVHLWTAFVSDMKYQSYDYSLPTSPSFWQWNSLIFIANRSISVGISGRYPVILPIRLSVLLSFELLVLLLSA